MNKIKKVLLNLWYGLPFGLKAAGDEIMGGGEADQAGTEINQQVTDKRVAKHLLKGEVTQEVEELRYRTYKVANDSEKYKYVWKERKDPETREPLENIVQVCFALRKVINSHYSRGMSVVDIVEEKHKAIIFYNFDFELEILKNLDYPDGTQIAEMNGHKHQDIPDSDYWVYLVHYNSGSEGWNCTVTDTIIFYSQNYSYRTMKQAAGRIDRRNTPYIDLYYYNIKSKAPMDIAIARALKNKKKFNETKFIEGKS